MPTRRASALVLILGLVLVACGGQDKTGSAPAAPSTTARPTSLNGPFFDVLLGELDYVTYERTMQRVQREDIAACLNKAGFRKAATPAASDESIQLTRLGLAYRAPEGLPDQHYRHRFGYGVYAGAVGVATPLDLSAVAPEPTPEESAAQDRCGAEMRKTVFGASVESFLEDWGQIDASAIADSRYVQAIQDWVGCMRNQGYNVKGLDDVSELVTQDLYAANRAGLSTAAQLKGFRASELTTAEADWSCRVKHVNAVWRSVRDEKETAYLEDHPELAKQVADDMHWVAQKAG